MSGVEVVGLISAIIGIVETIANVYSSLKDAENLPRAFRKVAERLPLVRETLRTAEKQVECNADEEAYQAIKTVLEKCKVKAEHLEEIFKAVVPSEGTSRFDRYRMAARRLGKGNQVEELAKDMMEDVRLLAENRAVQAATEAQVVQLVEAIKDLSSMEPSLPDEDFSISQSHYGYGDNVAGNKYSGNHNVYSGSGTANFGPVTNHGRN